MWKWFHQFAKPERLYPLCGRLIPWFGGGAIICLAVGWVWGLGFAPSDYQQGDSFRIMYLHVPGQFGRWVSICRWLLLRLWDWSGR